MSFYNSRLIIPVSLLWTKTSGTSPPHVPICFPHSAAGPLLSSGKNRCRLRSCLPDLYDLNDGCRTPHPDRDTGDRQIVIGLNLKLLKIGILLHYLVLIHLSLIYCVLICKLYSLDWLMELSCTLGGEHWTTRSTSGMSNPRAATLVATRTSNRPFLKPFSVISLCFWGISPWRDCVLCGFTNRRQLNCNLLQQQTWKQTAFAPERTLFCNLASMDKKTTLYWCI